MHDEPGLHEVIEDEAFRRAVTLIDEGDVDGLDVHLAEHPHLLRVPARFTEESFESGTQAGQYFHQPKLLWFIAENPIRHRMLPDNISEVARVIIEHQSRVAPDTLEDDLNMTLALVTSGCVAREAGKLAALVSTLVEAGAGPDTMDAALAHGETEAVRLLLAHGGKPTIVTATLLNETDGLDELFNAADSIARRQAFCVAAIEGHLEMVRYFLGRGLDPSLHNPDGFHAHATPLHEATLAGHVDVVDAMIDAGADLLVKDKNWDGTPADWAEHGGHQALAERMRNRSAIS